MEPKHTPDINDFPGMVAVPEQSFFAVIGKLDVHPSVSHSPTYNRIFGYVSTWTLRNGVVVGKSTGGTPFSRSLYMVTENFYAANRAKFDAAADMPPLVRQNSLFGHEEQPARGEG